MIMTRKCTLPVCILELIFLRPGHFKKCFLFPGCHNTVLHDLCQVFCCCRMYALSSSASSPFGVIKWVSLQPISAAFAFISFANSSTLPAMPLPQPQRCHYAIPASGNTTVFDVEHFPFLHPKMYLRLGRSLIRYFYRLIRTSRKYSNARIHVMIFVVLAIGRTTSASFPNNTRPLSASISTADLA